MADDTQPDGTTPPDFDSLLNATSSSLSNFFGIGGAMDWFVNNLVKWVALNIGLWFRALPRIATYIATFIQMLVEQSNPEFAKLATSTLGMMFGEDANVGGKFRGGFGAGLQDGAAAVGHSVLESVFGSIDMSGGSSLQPGTERAEAYLGSVTELVMRGWFLSVITEWIPGVNFHVFHELEEELISGLGLGRIARTVLHPIVSTLIAEPAQWAMNLAYRPKLAAPDVAIDMWMRGAIDGAELDDVLGRQGYGPDHIEALKVRHRKHLSVGELDVLYGHEQVHDGEIIDALKLDGYDEQTAPQVWLSKKLAHFDAINMREVDVLMTKLEAGYIDQHAFEEALADVPLYPGVGTLLLNVARARMSTPRAQLSVADLMTAWENQVLTQNEVHDRLVRRGYSEDDAATLLLTRLAIGQHKHEVQQLRVKAQADRAAASAAAKAARVAAAAEKAAAAATARAKKATELAQQKAQASADAEARRQFVEHAAEQKRQLVAAQHAAEQITADQLAVANAQISADTAALLAQIAAQVQEEDAAFARQKLDLQTENREADLSEALANIDVAAEADAKLRDLAVEAKRAANDALLAEKLADIDTLYADRQTVVQADLENASAAVDVSTLPTSDERAAAAQTKISALDATLQRKLTDIDAEYDDKQAATEKEHDDGTITDKTYETRTDNIQNARDQAKRAAQQSHDLAIAALTTAGATPHGATLTSGATAKSKLQTQAQAKSNQLAVDKVSAQLAAHLAHDKTALDLQVIAQQIGPITAAEAARRKLALQQQDDAAKRNEHVLQTEIAKSQADAAGQLAKVQATAAAAHQRLATLRTATSARESATAAAVASEAALASSQEQAREALERTIAAHRSAVSTDNPA